MVDNRGRTNDAGLKPDGLCEWNPALFPLQSLHGIYGSVVSLQAMVFE